MDRGARSAERGWNAGPWSASRGRIRSPASVAPAAAALALVLAGGQAAFGQETVAARDFTLTPTLRQYERQEISFAVAPSFSNPYDPDVIRIDAVFSSPTGREQRVPAFYWEAFNPYTNSRGTGSGWKVRFTPVEVGTYLVRLTSRLPAGESTALGTLSFQCAPGARTGFVKRSGRGFALEDGTAFLPIGANRCWGDSTAPERYLGDMERLAAAGANCLRVWLAPWWQNIEPEPGRYAQGGAALLDAVTAKAEALGLKLMLCIEQHGNLQPDGAEIALWPRHPYNRVNGGPCEEPWDFFNMPEARKLFRNRLRYLVARWGCSPAVMAWELFNEVEFVGHGGWKFDLRRREAVAWHREMSAFLRETDAFGRLIATSSDAELQATLARATALDMIQTHLYKEADLAHRLREILSALRQETRLPLFVGEFGTIKDHDDGRMVTRGLFVAALAGQGAGALPWLQDVKDPTPFYARLSAARRFLQTIPWQDAALAPIGPEVVVEHDLMGGDGRLRNLTDVEPAHVVGLKTEDQAWLFAYAGPDTGRVRPPQRVRLRVPGMKAGRHVVELWNPALGRSLSHQTGTADEAGLLIEIAECPAELALHTEWAPPE